MPTGRLVFVEGQIDKEVLVSLVGTQVTVAGERLIVQRRGSKNTLAMEAKTIAKEGENDVYFVRDRDFDFLPPDDLSQPKPIKAEVVTIKHPNKVKREVKGWHWCRHEIENYLLTPEIVKRASYRKKSGYSFKIIEYRE